LELELRRSKEESAALAARADVLRQAISQHNPGEVPASVQASDGLQELLDREKQQSADVQKMAEAKQLTIESLTAELNALRQEYSRLSDVEVKAAQQHRANEELRKANQDLEHEQDRLVQELEAARREVPMGAPVRDFDPTTTKVLHFRYGPGVVFPARGSGQEEVIASLREEIRCLRAESGGSSATGDLEGRQASRQLERFKKATKKYVQDFREGTYNLLGWKVEMKGDGKAMKWHLTSSYQEGQELVFQLRPGEAGAPPEFDLLSTPWGEQLQADNKEAMAYLEVYRSIPGFLASITADLLSRHTIPG
jgi:mitotic spindle assembly checkpoint protein MAD1